MSVWDYKHRLQWIHVLYVRDLAVMCILVKTPGSGHTARSLWEFKEYTLAVGLQLAGNNTFWMGSPWLRYPSGIPLPSSSLIPPWSILGSPLTWYWTWSYRFQYGEMRSVQRLKWFLLYVLVSSRTSTPILNLIFSWCQILTLIIFLDLLIKTIPCLLLTSLYWRQSYPSVT